MPRAVFCTLALGALADQCLAFCRRISTSIPFEPVDELARVFQVAQLLVAQSKYEVNESITNIGPSGGS